MSDAGRTSRIEPLDPGAGRATVGGAVVGGIVVELLVLLGLVVLVLVLLLMVLLELVVPVLVLPVLLLAVLAEVLVDVGGRVDGGLVDVFAGALVEVAICVAEGVGDDPRDVPVSVASAGGSTSEQATASAAQAIVAAPRSARRAM